MMESWAASDDQVSQTGTEVDATSFHTVPVDVDAPGILDLDRALEPLPAMPEALKLDLQLWPAAVRWNVDIMSAFGSSFGSYTRPKLSFLARFTSTDGIGNSFACGDAEQRRQIMMFLLQGQLCRQDIDICSTGIIMAQPGPLNLDLELGMSHGQAPLLFHTEWNKQQGEMSRDNIFDTSDALRTSAVQDALFDDLASRTQEIVLGIRDVVRHRSRKSPITITWSPSRETLCYRFFSPENLERFLLAFWAMWYPNWPVFHRPTFVAARKPGTLLAAMALIGASLTSENTDRDQAMVWADAVEEWVFSDDAFCDGNIPRTDDEFEDLQVETRLDALRAAYAVVLFLSWEGAVEQKKRARRTRFSQVITVARSLQFSAAAHENLNTYTCAPDQLRGWKTFILREELIRTMMFVFLLDCGYLIFNNTQPRMAVFELQCQMACPEVCFQADTLESWAHAVGIWSNTTIGRRQPLMSTVIEIVMRAHPSKEDWEMLQQMSSLNFFAIGNRKYAPRVGFIKPLPAPRRCSENQASTDDKASIPQSHIPSPMRADTDNGSPLANPRPYELEMPVAHTSTSPRTCRARSRRSPRRVEEVRIHAICPRVLGFGIHNLQAANVHAKPAKRRQPRTGRLAEKGLPAKL